MTTITIEKAIVHRALSALEYHTQQTRPIHNTELVIEELRAALSAPATAPEQCWCDEQGLGEPGVSCGDCPTRDYKAPPLSEAEIQDLRDHAIRILEKSFPAHSPAWHDAPTEPGTWILSLDSGMEVQENITQHEIDIEATWPGGRWYGPIPEDK